jgi:hypothetical protein
LGKRRSLPANRVLLSFGSVRREPSGRNSVSGTNRTRGSSAKTGAFAVW